MNTPAKPRPRGARRPARHQSTSEVSPPPNRQGFVESFDQTRVFYSVEGEGEPLVFCYGLVCSSLHWTYQIDYFRKNYQAIWFDYRGHQNSDVPEELDSINLKNLAEDLKRVLDELKIEKATLLGHSMGVNVVLEFYHLFPERVKAIVLAHGTPKSPAETLMGGNYLGPVLDLLNTAYSKTPRLLNLIWGLQKGSSLTHALIGMGGFNSYLTPRQDVAKYVDEVAAMDVGIFLSLFKNYQDYDSTPWLHTIDVPTLILSGEEDKVTPPAMQKLMHQLIPNSELIQVPWGSHCSQMDLPEYVNQKIEHFLKNRVLKNTSSGLKTKAPQKPRRSTPKKAKKAQPLSARTKG